MSINFTLILEVISFLILVAVLTKIAYRPLLSFLDKRSQELKKIFDEARQVKEESEKNDQASKIILQAAREEVLRMKDMTRQELDKTRLLMMESAKKEAAGILQKAKLELTEETKLAREVLRKDVSSISLEIAKKIIEREIKEKDHKRLIEKSLKELGSG
ncbi:MAG: F0F1 ATP synthase subunit B [Candidatus Omnitrophota bacterium]|nr:F0F1 ATP synthase subunit B [Candidatus Omnitrophota bacterium]